MYPPSSSSSASSTSCSSSHGSMAPTGGGGGNLTRYGSAPSSLLSTAVDSITGPNTQFGPPTLAGPTHTHYFSSSSDTESKANTSTANIAGLQRSYCFNSIAAADVSSNHMKNTSGGSSLVRHNSSPAGFLNRLAAATSASDNVSRGLAVYNSKGGSDNSARGISRLNSQLSFTKDCLSQISEESSDDGHRKEAHSYAAANFGMGSWDDANGVMFSLSPSKRAKSINTNISNGFNIVESQLQFGLAETALEMATMENLIDIPQDSVPCKIRAKRGCATHPRSIAERERRTRISGKLKKLQDLVPNMDKQTSYSDMLDLAVQHIKGLQTQVQELHKEVENCTCGCEENT